jgi:H+/Cl- antiporter ClcA
MTGFLAGGVIVLFRLAVESTQAGFLPGNLPENYEALPPWLRLLLPLLGGLLIGLIFERFAKGLYVLGIARIMERLAYHQGHLSLREFFLQFIGAAVAIISGHSVGREGPHVFLGAASGSLLGQQLVLPNNTIRTLVGCGAAAGIAASFNTPLAGVIFALEVIMMEYSLASFIPIILAAVSANSLSLLFLSDTEAFVVSSLQLGSLHELVFVLLLGILAGTVSAIFVHLLQLTAKQSRRLQFWHKTSLGGLIVGLCGLLTPEVLGIGYDTVNLILLGEVAISFLLLLVVMKLLATTASIGLGIPGGMIGPALFIGAAVGGSVAPLPVMLLEGPVSDPGFYALIGMGAVMGASLQAPLAALTAIIELTHNPQVVMPGMLAIVVASLTSSELFQKKSLFLTMLQSSGLDYRDDPVMQSLRRVGVASIMNRGFYHCSSRLTRNSVVHILDQTPEWILVDAKDAASMELLPGVDLARYIEEHSELDDTDEIDLLQIPARRYQLTSISILATLQEALDKLDKTGAEALYVERIGRFRSASIEGILTREQIESAYRF